MTITLKITNTSKKITTHTFKLTIPQFQINLIKLKKLKNPLYFFNIYL